MYYLFKIVATSVCFPLHRLRRKMSRAKGNLSRHILEYSTPCPKSQAQIWTSNIVGAKFYRWQLWITSLWRQLIFSLVLEIPRYSSGVFLFDFHCRGLLCFSFLGELYEWWNGEMVKRIFPHWDFTMLLLSWVTTCMGYNIIGGGHRLLLGLPLPLPPQLPITTSSTGQAEQDIRLRGVQSFRVTGGQTGIIWIPLRGGRPLKVHCCWQW